MLNNLVEILRMLGHTKESTEVKKLILLKNANSVGNIVKILGYPKSLAMIINERFGKNAFIIAKWLKESNSVSNLPNEWLNRLGTPGSSFSDTKGSVLRAFLIYEESFKGFDALKKALEDNYISTHYLVSEENIPDYQETFKLEIIKEIENDIIFYNKLGEDILNGKIKDLSRFKNMTNGEAVKRYDEKLTFEERKPLITYPNGYKWINVGVKSSIIRDDLDNCGGVSCMTWDRDGSMFGLFDENNKAVGVVTYSPNENRVSGADGRSSKGINEEYYEYTINLADILNAKLDVSSTVENKQLDILYKFRKISKKIKLIHKGMFDTIMEFSDKNGNQFYTNTYEVSDKAATDMVVAKIKNLPIKEQKDLFFNIIKDTNELIAWTFSPAFADKFKDTDLKKISIHNFLKEYEDKLPKDKNASRKFDLYKFSGEFAGKCQIYNIQDESFGLDIGDNEELDQERYISPGGDSVDYFESEKGIDYYDLLNEVEQIFKDTGVRISSQDKFFEACIDDDGKVYGASVIYYYMNDGAPTVRFSVAVNHSLQGGGVGKNW